ncbi:hypothetical protein FS837_004306 [Tulasnella sp. UAMH 9824]|nr:hypothetical protein FS837_004306 [Tulasnella sp. UAMH 9824]
MDAPNSASGPDQLKFFGKDSNECENFIADSCLRQDALHWWAELDEATQGSWKLLRKALFLRFGPIFCGESGKEAEKFVFWIRQRARNAGKLEDPQWIATFASPFFAGRALRWYSSLQMNVQKDWNALQRAIFMQYPREGEGGEESSIIPTPPSAIVTSPAFKAHRRGYIKLIMNNDSKSYYLSKNRHSDGFLLVGTSLDNALEVEYREDDRNEQHTLYIPDSQVANFDVLGIKWEKANPATSTSLGHNMSDRLKLREWIL